MSSGFVTESEAAEARKKRQEEWERVRKPSDPLERPEETFDGRSLYARLQEQKQKKELEYEEAHKLKNMIKGLDDDEIEFLDLIDRKKLQADKMKEMEEEKALRELRERVVVLKNIENGENVKITAKTSPMKTCISQQQKLLKGAVVVQKKRKNEDGEKSGSKSVEIVVPQSSLKCIGILPGLGCYNESSDSSDSEIEPPPKKFDLVGRKIETPEEDKK